MEENNFEKQLKDYYINESNENLDLDINPEGGFYLENGEYVLTPEQKKLIMDYNSRFPYETFRYYFIVGSHSISADIELMNYIFDNMWTIKLNSARQGYLVKIYDDDIIYTNLIEYAPLIADLEDSMNNITEDLELDVFENKGELKKSPWGAAYFLGDKEKVAMLDLMDSLDPTGKDGWYFPVSTPKYLRDECIQYRWGILDYSPLTNTFNFFDPMGEQSMDIPEKFMSKIILDNDPETIIAALKNINEEIEVDVTNTNTPEALAAAIADRIGDCVVDGSVIYQLFDDFEVYNEDTGDFEEIDRGIFAVYEVLPPLSIISYDTKLDTCREIEGIGTHDIKYYANEPTGIFKDVKEFIIFLNSYFGKDWFGTYEETEDFLSQFYDKTNEELDLNVQDLSSNKDAYNLVKYNGISARLLGTGKEDVAAFLDMDADVFENMSQDEWVIQLNSEELDPWYDSNSEDFPFALIIGDKLYDVLSDSVVEDILKNRREEYFLE